MNENDQLMRRIDIIRSGDRVDIVHHDYEENKIIKIATLAIGDEITLNYKLKVEGWKND